MLTPIINFFARVAHWFWYRATLQLKLVIITAILLLLAAAAVGIYVGYLKYQIVVEKEARSQQGQIAVDAAKANAKEAANKSNQSLENSNKARQANINSLPANFDETRRQYCIDFPEDCR